MVERPDMSRALPRVLMAEDETDIAQLLREAPAADARPSGARMAMLELALATIPPRSDVVELGSGAGLPMTAALADGRRVTGYDISAAQVALGA